MEVAIDVLDVIIVGFSMYVLKKWSKVMRYMKDWLHICEFKFTHLYFKYFRIFVLSKDQ